MNQPEALLEASRRLGNRFSGTILGKGDEGYDDARRVHNGMIDKCPAVIMRCRNAKDIAVALELARDHGLEVSVKGAGHNVAGRAVCEGGVMIDLSLMHSVRVDPAARTATVEGGATWAQFNRATQEHGLATTGGVISSTGVAGLTLGGGLGWTMGRFGMAVDNLVEVELVTADGTIRRVNATSEPDLFWGVRGAGGQLGIAASLTFRVHPLGEVIGGLVVHPFDRGPEMLRTYRDITKSASDDLTVFSGLLHAPDGSGNKIGAMVVCHLDPRAGVAAVAPIKAFGPPVMDAIGPMPYEQLNMMLDGGFPKGALSYWKSGFLEALTDGAIDAMAAVFRDCPAPMGAMLLEHFHGAVTRIDPTATAFPHRRTGYNLAIIAEWLDPAQSAACVAWARKAYETMRPFMTAGRYVNYLPEDESGDLAAAFGPNTERLKKVKKQYDPGNVFRLK